MNHKQFYMLRTLRDDPTAFLAVRRRPLVCALVVKWTETKLHISQGVLLRWITDGYVTRSAHLPESYIIGEAGCKFVAACERRAPVKEARSGYMNKLIEARRLAREAGR